MAPARLALGVIVILLVGASPSSAAHKWFAWLEELSGPGPFRGNTLRIDIACSGRLPEGAVEQVQADVTSGKLTTRRDALRKAQEGAGNTTSGKSAASGTASLPTAEDVLAKKRWCDDHRTNVRFSVGYEQGWWDAAHNSRYDGTVRLRTYTAVLFVPVKAPFLEQGEVDTSALRALEVGLGLSAYRLTGTAVVDRDYWRLAVPLRARIFLLDILPPPSKPSPTKVTKVVRTILKPLTLYVGLDYIPGELPSSAFRLTDVSPPSRLSQSEWVPTWGINIDVLAFRDGRSLLR
jgi:hypothetical protein